MLWPAAGGTGGVGSQLQIDQLESRTLLTAAVVNTIIDGHFPPGSGTVSLRDAIAAADTSASDTAITFDPTVFSSPQTIVLNGSQLDLSNMSKTTITGPPGGVTISGNNASRVFYVHGSGATTLSGLTITKGNSVDGAGIFNSGTLMLTNDTVTGNTATSSTGASSNNGGVDNEGTATLTKVTISNNTALNSTGGIANGPGHSVTLVDSTISGNSAGGDIGGLYNDGTASLTNVTISGNSARTAGGFINDASADSMTFANTIVAGNTAVFAGPDAYHAINSIGYNLVGKTDGSSGWNGLDLTGTIANPLNTKLAALGILNLNLDSAGSVNAASKPADSACADSGSSGDPQTASNPSLLSVARQWSELQDDVQRLAESGSRRISTSEHDRLGAQAASRRCGTWTTRHVCAPAAGFGDSCRGRVADGVRLQLVS
jgi:hypothetical protein